MVVQEFRTTPQVCRAANERVDKTAEPDVSPEKPIMTTLIEYAAGSGTRTYLFENNLDMTQLPSPKQ